MAISKFNNKYKTFNNKKKIIIKSKIIRKYSKIYRGGAAEVPKQIISDEELQKIYDNFIKILEKELSITECPKIIISQLTGKTKFGQKIYEEFDKNYLLIKIIKFIPINYFSNKTISELKNFTYFIEYIKQNKFNIKYNDKCYEIDRWKLFFDSYEIIENFNESKYNDITFNNFLKQIKDLKTLEGENEKMFLEYIKPIYIELKTRFFNIIPDEFINTPTISITNNKDKPIIPEFLNIGWNFDGVLNLNVIPMLNNNDLRTNISDIYIPNLYIENLILKDFIHKQIKNHIISSNKNIENIKDYKFNNKTMKEIFNSFVSTEDKINELKTKNIKYYFDDSNKNIIDIRKSKIDGNLPELNKLFKVFPESQTDICDFKSNPEKAIGTYNKKFLDISLDDDKSNIKILTYYVDYLDNKTTDNINKIKAVRKILKKYMEEDNADFVCLQNFSYYNNIDNNILYNDIIKYNKDAIVVNLHTISNHPLTKLNNIDNDINNKIKDDTLEKYDYVYNNRQFTFFNQNKYKRKILEEKYIYLRYNIKNEEKNKVSYYPFTIIIFSYLLYEKKDINIILINTNLPYNKTNNEINDFINTEFSKNINEADTKKFKDIEKKKKNKDFKSITKEENDFMKNIMILKIQEDIKSILQYSPRIFMAGNFERTIYSNKDKETYYSNKINKENNEIDNSAYGLKLFKGLYEENNEKSIIMYNIPDIDKRFEENTCCFLQGKISNPKYKYGHIDNVLDSYGLQYKYEYYKSDIPCRHLPLLVTFLEVDNTLDSEYILKIDIENIIKSLTKIDNPLPLQPKPPKPPQPPQPPKPPQPPQPKPPQPNILYCYN